jgi:hypothetical protein
MICCSSEAEVWKEVADNRRQRRMAFEPSQEQALAVFTASGEAVRFLVSQKWHVTYLVLLAYGALAAAPPLICKNVANSVCVAANRGCAVVALVLAGFASWHLCNLDKEHAQQFEIVYAAGKELQLVLDLHGWTEAPEPGSLILLLVGAVLIGAVLVICINLSRR